jgi:U3 small nucleolar ribonucleoprotein component
MLEFALDGTEDPAKSRVTSTTDNLEQDSQEEEEEEEEDDDDDSDSTYEGSDDDSESDQEVDGSSDGQPPGEDVIGLRDHSMEEDEELTEESHVPSSVSPPRTEGGHFGLNDNFFDLEKFNAETEEAEAGFVSNGALDADLDDIASDEDDIDYFASVDGQVQADDDRGSSIVLSAITPLAKY